MKNWLISIIMASFLLSSVSSLLPEGSIKRGVLTAFGFIFITIIIAPVVNFFSNGLPLDVVMLESIAETENSGDEYVSTVINDFKERIENQCMLMLNEKNIEANITVDVNQNPESEDFCKVLWVKCMFYKNEEKKNKTFNIEKILIDFDGISFETENTSNEESEKENIRNIISDFLSIEKENVYVEFG